MLVIVNGAAPLKPAAPWFTSNRRSAAANQDRLGSHQKGFGQLSRLCLAQSADW
jgi:hypothetical protein